MPQISGLKFNKSKCKEAGIGVMKRVKVTLCDVECVNLLNNAIKILVIYDKKLENEKNCLDLVTKLYKL